MDAFTALFLGTTGLLGGVITAIVGGSSLICFPAMLAAGLPPIVASASNTTAVVPASLIAAYSDTGRTPSWSARIFVLTLIGFVGSAVGALLLIALPERVFVAAVPILIGLATVLFAWGDRLRAVVARFDTGRTGTFILQPLLFAPVAVYGGYFGAGMGVMTLAILGLSGSDDHRAANALKNLLTVLTNVVSIAIYIAHGIVAWPETAAMMTGALIGGFVGGRSMRFLPAGLFRALVVGMGAVLTVVFAWRYWNP
jgi:uncharacterized membrane protein YfcA